MAGFVIIMQCRQNCNKRMQQCDYFRFRLWAIDNLNPTCVQFVTVRLKHPKLTLNLICSEFLLL